jgi:hypothetical protein
VIVQGSLVEVIGKSSVLVVDARQARVSETPTGAPAAATGLILHVLRAGMSMDLR